jgi:hypothetical protein
VKARVALRSRVEKTAARMPKRRKLTMPTATKRRVVLFQERPQPPSTESVEKKLIARTTTGTIPRTEATTPTDWSQMGIGPPSKAAGAPRPAKRKSVQKPTGAR